MGGWEGEGFREGREREWIESKDCSLFQAQDRTGNLKQTLSSEKNRWPKNSWNNKKHQRKNTKYKQCLWYNLFMKRNAIYHNTAQYTVNFYNL